MNLSRCQIISIYIVGIGMHSITSIQAFDAMVK